MTPEQEQIVLKLLVKLADTKLKDSYQDRVECPFCWAEPQFASRPEWFEHKPDCVVALARELRQTMNEE